MTQSSPLLDLQALLDKAQSLQGYDMYRELLRDVIQVLLEAERDQHVGVPHYSRGEERTDTHSGYKDRLLETPVGTLSLRKPQTRLGMQSQILEQYERVDQAILLTAREMYLHGVSTRKVKDLLQRTIGTEVSPTTVSKTNKRLDEAVQNIKQKPLG